MNRFFSPDSFLIKTLSTLCDLMLLNLLFIICCIPIFTIGASLSSMYTVTFKMQRGQDPSISKEFFKAFKTCFKQSTVIWIPSSLLLLFLGSDIFIILTYLDKSYKYLQYPILVIMFLLIAMLVYVFPQIAVFDTSNKLLIKNSVLLFLGNFPTTIFALAIIALLLGITTLSGKCLILILSLLMFFGFAAIAFLFTVFFRRIFQKIAGEDTEI